MNKITFYSLTFAACIRTRWLPGNYHGPLYYPICIKHTKMSKWLIGPLIWWKQNIGQWASRSRRALRHELAMWRSGPVGAGGCRWGDRCQPWRHAVLPSESWHHWSPVSRPLCSLRIVVSVLTFVERLLAAVLKPVILCVLLNVLKPWSK